MWIFVGDESFVVLLLVCPGKISEFKELHIWRLGSG